MANNNAPPADKDSQTFTLDDGRQLGYRIYGSATGHPLFYFHGFMGCRLEAVFWDAAGRQHNVKVIGVDRPGIGLSTFKRDATLRDWASAVQQLATHLEFGTYRVVGGSAGGPYALACARFIPKENLLGTAVASGIAPPEAGTAGSSWTARIVLALMRNLPWTLSRMALDMKMGTKAQSATAKEWDAHMATVFASVTPEEQELLRTNPERKQHGSQILREAFRQGSNGVVLDAGLFMGSWGFALEEIEGEVLMWNGTADTSTPVQGARWQAGKMRNAKLRELEGVTHVGMFAHHVESVVAGVMTLVAEHNESLALKNNRTLLED